MVTTNHDGSDCAGADETSDRSGALRKAGAIGAATTLAGGSALAMLTALAGPASAATFTVTQASDDGTGTVSGTLSWAISQAEADPAADVIDFSPSLTTVTFTGAADQVRITEALSIAGPGADALTIDFAGNCGLAAEPNSDVALSISGLTLANGFVSGGCDSRDDDMGGALVVYYGGGYASLTISGVTFDNNYSYYYGGGLACDGDVAVSIVNSTFTGNSTEEGGGGGIYLDCRQDVTISGSIISGNTAGGDGGGAKLQADEGNGNTVEVIDSTFSDNTSGRKGGGALFEGGLGLVLNSTFNGNSATQGGGLAGDTPVSVVQSTITDNTSNYAGGGMWWKQGAFIGGSNTTFDIVMSTISGNTSLDGTGNELAVERINSTPQSSYITGSIIAGTASGSSIFGSGRSPEFYWPIEVSNSILGTVVSATITDDGGNSFDVADPLLGDLADNGGPTKTMVPADDSPAIDAGPATVPDFPSNEFDQRGTPYVRVYNDLVDVGAVEVQPAPDPTPPDPDPTPEPVGPAFTG